MLIYWLLYGHARDLVPVSNWMANPKPIFNVDSSDVFWYYEILAMKCLLLRLFSYDLEWIYKSSERFRSNANIIIFAQLVAYAVINDPASKIFLAMNFMWGLSVIRKDVIFLKYLLFFVACVLAEDCHLVLDGQLIVYACKLAFFFPLEMIVCITVMFLIGLKFSLGMLFLFVVYELINAQNSKVKAQQQYYSVLALTIFLKRVILPSFSFSTRF